MKQQKAIITILSALLILSLTGNILFVCNHYQIYQKSAKESLKQPDQLLTTQAMNEYAESYAEQLLEQVLTPAQIEAIAQEYYQYYFMVNDQMVTGETMKLRNPSKVRITLVEAVSTTLSLPELLQKRGSLLYQLDLSEFTKYVEIVSPVEYEVLKVEDGANIKYYIDFENVPQNTEIKIVIGDYLWESLSDENLLKGKQFTIVAE